MKTVFCKLMSSFGYLILFVDHPCLGYFLLFLHAIVSFTNRSRQSERVDHPHQEDADHNSLKDQVEQLLIKTNDSDFSCFYEKPCGTLPLEWRKSNFTLLEGTMGGSTAQSSMATERQSQKNYESVTLTQIFPSMERQSCTMPVKGASKQLHVS